MSAAHQLSETTVIDVETATDLMPTVLAHIERGTRTLCVDASALPARDADEFVEAVDYCATLVHAHGGSLSIVCALAAVRRRLWNAGLLVVSDRATARAVVG